MDVYTNEPSDLRVIGHLVCLNEELTFVASPSFAKVTYISSDPETSSCVVFTREEWGDRYIACAHRRFTEISDHITSYMVRPQDIEEFINQGQT